MVKQAAFLFPGQGSQFVGMGKSAAESSLDARRLLEAADRTLGFSLSKIMFEGPDEKLRETAVTQPALFVASAMALELLRERGCKPSWTAGHSLGEFSALYAAGAIGFEDALNLVQTRGRAMQEAATQSPGAMAAILGLDEQNVSALCAQVNASDGVCAPANFNSESQIVISGHTSSVLKAMDLLTKAGAARVVRLNVSGAFHSSLMSSAARQMTEPIGRASFSSTVIPVITNVDAQPTTSAAEFKVKLIKQIDHAVRWHDTLTTLLAVGAEVFIEVGAGKVLGTMVKKRDRSKTVLFTDEFADIDRLKETLCV